MGVYAESTYAAHGRHWQQVLFYSHVYGLAFSVILFPILQSQFMRLWTGPQIGLPAVFTNHPVLSTPIIRPLKAVVPEKLANELHARRPSKSFLLLWLNAATQVVCITGVNRLSSATTAVTVTVVLNIRKLVSFLLSCIIFGNKMDPLMATGAGIVFASGALYGWESSQRKPKAPPPGNSAPNGNISVVTEKELTMRGQENGKAE